MVDPSSARISRAFPPDDERTPPAFRAAGQPVLVPGDMGRYSFVLAGTQRAFDETFGSTCHGAGRRMSRGAFFDRRAFMISYDPTSDDDGRIVEGILLAAGPALVLPFLIRGAVGGGADRPPSAGGTGSHTRLRRAG